MWSHPLKSIRVPKNCKVCAAKQEKTDATICTLKDKLQTIRETFARLQKSEDAGEMEEEEGEIDLDAEPELEAFH